MQILNQVNDRHPDLIRYHLCCDYHTQIDTNYKKIPVHLCDIIFRQIFLLVIINTILQITVYANVVILDQELKKHPYCAEGNFYASLLKIPHINYKMLMVIKYCISLVIVVV